MPHEIIYAYVKISRQRFELIDVRLAVAVLPMRDRHFRQAQQFGNVRLRELVFRAQFFEPVFEFHTFSVTNFEQICARWRAVVVTYNKSADCANMPKTVRLKCSTEVGYGYLFNHTTINRFYQYGTVKNNVGCFFVLNIAIVPFSVLDSVYY